MGLMDKIRGEFVDIVEWTEPPQNDILAYRFERYQNEIKMGAKLIVREGQNAVFVNQGQLADLYTPGSYTLTTETMPVFATLKGWKYGFDAPFRAEVYFISMRQWTDQKWGTQNPVMMRDPEFGPVRIRAFGTYAFHVSDPKVLLRQLVATDPLFETHEISNHLRGAIASRFTDVLAEAKISVLDLAGNYEKIANLALEAIRADFAALGLKLALFYIENMSVPPEVEQALDARSQIGVLGDMNQYARLRSATAIGDAARNPGGAAGAGVGIGAGIALGQQIGASFGPAAPPPAPVFFVAENGKQTGPFDMETLAAKARNGALLPHMLVWRRGLPDWITAGAAPELQPLFQETPPPLPAR